MIALGTEGGWEKVLKTPSRLQVDRFFKVISKKNRSTEVFTLEIATFF